MALGALVLGAAGVSCSPPKSVEELRQEILSRDPAFGDALGKRHELASRIDVIERNFELKRTKIEQRIEALRQELKGDRAKADQDIDKTKALLEPDLERLRLALSLASEERRAKQQQLASLKRSLSQMRRALKEDRAQWTTSERAEMERDLADLQQAIERMGHESTGLDEHIRLLKMKQRVLRL